MAIKTHYDNLQVSRNASDAVIRAAYKSLIQKHHPDKNLECREDAERITRIINEAFEVLSNLQQRKEHDEWITAVENLDRSSNQNIAEEISIATSRRKTKDPDLSDLQVDTVKIYKYLLLYFGLVAIVFGMVKGMGF